ncbi:MAG: DUF2442 domain-containing protein [Myxococcales bacterium]|nr:DUF2442 domain-containing protein [Myxococcales bacterium]
MLVRIIEVDYRGGHRLLMRFDDGTQGEVDIAEAVPLDGVLAALRDPAVFRQARVDPEWGTVCWPDDLDLAPEPLFERITGRNPLEMDPRPASPSHDPAGH